MSASLDIFFPPDDSQSALGKYYAAPGSSPAEYRDETAIREIALTLPVESVRLFIPGEWVAVHQTALPVGGRKQAEKLLPALLEEDVSENIEALHFALLACEDEQAMVAVIEQQKMQLLTNWMQTRGITSRTVLPDWMAQACATLQILGGRCLLRATPWLGWSCPQALASVLLAAQLPLAQPLQVFYRGELPSELEPLLQAHDAVSLYQQLPAPRADSSAASLLSGSWKPRTPYRQQWQQWRKVCYAIAAGLLMLTVERGLSLWRVHSQVQQSQQQVTQRFQQLFPAQKRIVNLRAQINTALRNSSPGAADEEMITLLPLVASTLATIQQPADIIRLKIDQPQQSLFLQLRVASYDYFQLYHDAFAQVFQVKQNDVQNAESYVLLGFTLGIKQDEEK